MADDFEESTLSEEQLDALLGSSDIGANLGKQSDSSAEIQQITDLLNNLPQSDVTISDEDLRNVSLGEFGGTLFTASPTVDTTEVQKAGVDLKTLYDINVRFVVELGRTFLFIKDIIHLGEGSIIELDKNVGDEVDIYINERLFGRGRLIIVDEYYGVQITQILNPALFKNV
ncbi:MAG: flagellar motor switch protein FliN [Leptospiraceae bacterium]|nr:flagellar motor switch protein FliN [Leptospiraceae bacterium]MDW7975217.1 flagellar motor switch protein FliN [Leptospiraceae bacterium]